MHIPEFTGRTAEQIVNQSRFFDCAWYVWQALAWVDYGKRHSSISALQYAALELRQGIEQLWFDIIISTVGGSLDIAEYDKCKGNSTKMYKVLRRLSPDYEKLVRFTNLMGADDHEQPRVIEWNIPRLTRLHGETSQYLHFYGIPPETTEKQEWIIKMLNALEQGAHSIWDRLVGGERIGIANVASMPPEVKDAWEGFRADTLDEASVLLRLRIARPVLRSRRLARGDG